MWANAIGLPVDSSFTIPSTNVVCENREYEERRKKSRIDPLRSLAILHVAVTEIGLATKIENTCSHKM